MAIEIDWLGGNCPVQAKGKIDGEPFYFRARGGGWSLSIGSEDDEDSSTGVHGKDVVGNPAWEYEEDYGDGPYDAGWMEEDVARQMIEKAAEMWRDSYGAKSMTYEVDKPIASPGSEWWPWGTRVRKIKGSSWNGIVVGYYQTQMTPIGYAVESEREPGSVQIYPQNALERVT